MLVVGIGAFMRLAWAARASVVARAAESMTSKLDGGRLNPDGTSGLSETGRKVSTSQVPSPKS